MVQGKLSENKKEIELWVKAAQDGDHDSFAKLYDIFIDPIYRYVYYRVKSDDAEDITETVFLRVWENLDKYRAGDKSSFSAWVFRIAHNLVVDYYRGRKEREFDELLVDVPDDKRDHSPIRTTESIIRKEVLKKAISRLKKTYQDILIYKFINSFSNAEIADIMNKTEGSIRILQFRALRALRVELEDLGVDYNL